MQTHTSCTWCSSSFKTMHLHQYLSAGQCKVTKKTCSHLFSTFLCYHCCPKKNWELLKHNISGIRCVTKMSDYFKHLISGFWIQRCISHRLGAHQGYISNFCPITLSTNPFSVLIIILLPFPHYICNMSGVLDAQAYDEGKGFLIKF